MKRLLGVVLVVPVLLPVSDAANQCRVPAPSFQGSVALKDPATGAFLEEPTSAETLRTLLPDQARAAPPDELVEEPVPAPAGGVRVRLKGRSLQGIRATRRPNGTTEISCGVEATASTVEGAEPERSQE